MTPLPRIAIVGSRDWKDERAVSDFVNTLPSGTTVISGGARGVDRMAENATLRRHPHLSFRVHSADWRRGGKDAGKFRNSAIVAEADIIVCFWDGSSRGTGDTLMKAIQAHKLVEVHYPDGRVTSDVQTIWNRLIEIGVVIDQDRD